MENENSMMEVDEAMDLRVESRKGELSTSATAVLYHHHQEPNHLEKTVRIRRSIPSLFETLVSPEGAIDQDSADVAFVCKDGKVVKGHRIILALASPFFTNLFKQQSVDSKIAIFVTNVSAEAITSVFELCYKQQVTIGSEEHLREVVHLLKKFGFNRKSISGAERFWPTDDMLFTASKDLCTDSQTRTNIPVCTVDLITLDIRKETLHQLPEPSKLRQQAAKLPQVEDKVYDKVTYWLGVADPNTSHPRIVNRESELMPEYSEEDTATFWFGDLSVTKISLPPPLSSVKSKAKTTSVTIKNSATSIQKIKKPPVPSKCVQNIIENHKDQNRMRWVHGCHICQASFDSFVKAYEHWMESPMCKNVPYQDAVFKYRQEGISSRYRCPLCSTGYSTLYNFSIHCLHMHPEYKKLLVHLISEDKLMCWTCRCKFEGPRDFHSHLGPDQTCQRSPTKRSAVSVA